MEMAIPMEYFANICLLIVLILGIVQKHEGELHLGLRDFLWFSLFAIYFCFVLTYKTPTLLFGQAIGSLMLAIILLLLNRHRCSWMGMSDLISIKYYVISLTLVIGILGLAKVIGEFNGILTYTKEIKGILILGTSITYDYNFYCVPFLISVYILDSMEMGGVKFYAIQIILGANIILSTSRRGAVIYFLTLLFIMIRNVMFKREKYVSVVIMATILLTGYAVFMNYVDSTIIQRLISRMDSLGFGTSFSVFDERAVRGNLAIELIRNYDWFELMFGRGFSYLEQYALTFSVEFGHDYPHNFLISSFLLGGGVNFIFTFTSIFYAFYRSLRIRKEAEYLVYSLILIVVFCIFSRDLVINTKLLVFLAYYVSDISIYTNDSFVNRI